MDLNIWFLSLPEGRQKALSEDKWALAQAAMDAGAEAEREACAKLIEPTNPKNDWTEYAQTKAHCAMLIRGRA